jgi:histidine triad (HIT) family protein
MTDQKTLFERIILGELASVKVYEDEVCIAIMDKFPVVRGQVLVIPRTPTDYAFALEDTTYTHLLSVAKKIATAIDASLQPLRTCLVIEGFEVPHAHVKLYPVTEPKLILTGGQLASDEELEATAQLIRQSL